MRGVCPSGLMTCINFRHMIRREAHANDLCLAYLYLHGEMCCLRRGKIKQQSETLLGLFHKSVSEVQLSGKGICASGRLPFVEVRSS